jgi:hypothetical protein
MKEDIAGMMIRGGHVSKNGIGGGRQMKKIPSDDAMPMHMPKAKRMPWPAVRTIPRDLTGYIMIVDIRKANPYKNRGRNEETE